MAFRTLSLAASAAGCAALVGLALTASGPALAEESFTFDMPTNMSRNSYLGNMAMRLTDDIRTATSGTVDLKFYEDAELIPVPEILNAVATGAVPAAFTWTGFFGGTVPVGKYFAGTPFGPNTAVLASWIWEGGGLEILQRGFDPINVQIFPCAAQPRESGGYYNEEMNDVSAYDGMRIRMAGWGGEVLGKLGASVTALPGSEIYLAMERGRIDATEFASPLLDENFKFYNLAKYYYFPGWHQSTAWNSLIFNKDAWNQLSELQQQQVILACRATVQRTMAETIPLQIDALERMKADGDFEVRQFPEEMIREIHTVWLDVLADNRAKHPLIDEAHESLQAHIARYQPWSDLQSLPAGLE
ncbi:MAG: TRAP transporter substrate-binding protein [Pseudomonadota bacterium]